MMADEIREGAVVRYMGSETKGWLRKGGLACVVKVTGNGKVRLRGRGGSPQFAALGQLELVSATDERGLFDRAPAARLPKGGGQQREPAGDSVTMAVDAITIDTGWLDLGEGRQAVAEPAPSEPGCGEKPTTDAERRVLDAWPRFEDGEPVLWGDLIALDEQACGEASSRVTGVHVDETTYDIECGGEATVINAHGVRQRRAQDSLGLVMQEARLAISAGRMGMDYFEELLGRAMALPGEGSGR